MTYGKINLTVDFNPRPFGRYRADGDRSAEVFRDDYLVPQIQEHEEVTVDLSGTNYYGSSFLEETFGGLVRQGYTEEQLQTKLKVVHERLPSIAQEAWMYIQEAQSEATGQAKLAR